MKLKVDVHNPVGVVGFLTVIPTQGSGFAATLGYDTKSRWDFGRHTQQNQLNLRGRLSVFKRYAIKDYQRLKADENSNISLEWNVNRVILKINYGEYAIIKNRADLNSENN